MSDGEKARSDFSPGRATIEESARAKINLFLHVGARRADGFHPLQSLAVFTGLGDVLAIEEAIGLSLIIGGPFAKGLEGEGDNLVLRAGRHIDARFQWSHALTFADDDTDKAALEKKLKTGLAEKPA